MRRQRIFHGRISGWLAILALQAAVVTALLWPALRASPHALPTTLAHSSATVPLLNAWTIWWNADRLRCGLEGYWDAPIFFPERGAFAFSEPQPATLVVAPVVWLTHSPVTAYYGYLWLSLFLNGVVTAICLRGFKIGWFSTVAGSLAMTWLPIAWDNFDAIQLVPLWGMLWSILALVRFSERPTLGRSAALAAACSSVFFLSVHHGVFFVVSLLPAVVWLVPKQNLGRWLGRCILTGVALAILLAPLLLPMSRAHAQQNFHRAKQTQQVLSATLGQWFHVPERTLWRLRSHGSASEEPTVRALNPGWARVALALVAIAGALKLRKRTPQVLFLATLATASFVLSFGTNLSLGSQELWPIVGRLVPPLDSARSIFRFAYITQMAIVLLATIGADGLLRVLKHRLLTTHPTKRSASRRRRSAAVLVLGGCLSIGWILALEVPPPKINLIGVPDVRVPRDWIAFLRERGEGRPIVCLPFVENFSEAGLESSAQWMLYATEHRLPLMNGYSGFFPRSWYASVERWLAPEMNEELARFLDKHSVRYLVVDRSKPTCLSAAESPLELGVFELRRVVEGERQIDVWQLTQK